MMIGCIVAGLMNTSLALAGGTCEPETDDGIRAATQIKQGCHMVGFFDIMQK
jgi:hypothetical protein